MCRADRNSLNSYLPSSRNRHSEKLLIDVCHNGLDFGSLLQVAVPGIPVEQTLMNFPMAAREGVLNVRYEALSKSQLKLEGKGFVVPRFTSLFPRFRFKTLGNAAENTRKNWSRHGSSVV